MSTKTIKNRISSLRLEMLSRNIDAYIITTDDNHASEYAGEYFKVREYFSGFTGSAGTLVITKDDAALWTDGRYFLQAADQLEGTDIELMRSGIEGVPCIAEYLEESVPENGIIGFNGMTVSCSLADKLKEALSEKNITFSYEEDLADSVWDDRPKLSAQPVWELNLPGLESRKEKLKRIRDKIIEKNCDCILLTALDQIAWTLNLRGNDIPCNPVFLSFMLISLDEAKLFINPYIVSKEILVSLNMDGIETLSYESISYYLSANCRGKSVWADKKWTSYSLMCALSGAKYIETSPCPVDFMKSIKSEAEQEYTRQAHLRDGVALTKFICWLKTNIGHETITELSASDKLLSLRKQQDKFFDISFDTIAGYGPHGAIIHYEPTEETNIEMKPESFCLVDSGGQYYDGTTDVTRTISLGRLTDEEKRSYTLVLKGHLALGNAKFKRGCTGGMLDVLARTALWEENLDYRHGTGHGVGFILNVHEGPQRISYVSSDFPIYPGMITSNEPGLYLEGKYGIRIENLVLSKTDSVNEYGEFLSFETLTLAPYDRDAIDTSLLNEAEKKQINEYHKRVFDSLSPYLSDYEKMWLEKETLPI